MIDFFLVAALAIMVVNVVLISIIPSMVRKAIKEELTRLFEGEYQ